MAEGHGRESWAHTSLIAALLANAHRDPKKGRPFRVNDFNPYGRERLGNVIEVTRENVSILRQAFSRFGGGH